MANSNRNRILHRFYEPLVLLYVLDRTQGDHLKRPDKEDGALEDITEQELRRRFLDALSYICDSEKGGDTTAAIAIASAPLTYFVASNKNVKDKVADHLKSVLTMLGELYIADDSQLQQLLSLELMKACVDFSEKRIRVYWKSLQKSFSSCLATSPLQDLRNSVEILETELTSKSSNHVELCKQCDSVLRSPDLNKIKTRAAHIERRGDSRNPFADVRHFIGRIAYHAKAVKTLCSAAFRLPALFLDPDVEPINSGIRCLQPPPVRPKLTLEGIAHRMLSANDPSLPGLQEHLRRLNQNHEVEEYVRKEYENKNFKPRVHAELIVLEHFYQNNLDFFENDRYIGCSKPACYCCHLYIREHPGGFVEPASHQKIYLNWMPPTSSRITDDSNLPLPDHERNMLNKMVKLIRIRTRQQIDTQTGKRQKHFDSITADSSSVQTAAEFQDRTRMAHVEDIGEESEVSHSDESSQSLESQFQGSIYISDADHNSDLDGGVALL